MKCLACGERLYAGDFPSRSIGKAAQTPTLGDLRRALVNISDLPDDAGLSLQISGVLDSNVMVDWDAEAPRV